MRGVATRSSTLKNDQTAPTQYKSSRPKPLQNHTWKTFRTANHHRAESRPDPHCYTIWIDLGCSMGIRIARSFQLQKNLKKKTGFDTPGTKKTALRLTRAEIDCGETGGGGKKRSAQFEPLDATARFPEGREITVLLPHLLSPLAPSIVSSANFGGREIPDTHIVF